ATLQDQLDQVQQVLHKAEEIAAAGEAAKQRAQQLIGVSIALLAVGTVLLVVGGRRNRVA
ncbi:MAG: hypothetical protein O6650_02495, partial [Actinobacteria bacterium]|nr:hypothetical protein [Actinomycetota bacterium]